MGRKMVDVLDKYAKDGGYAGCSTVSQQTPIIYEANQIDITQDIIRLYDESVPGEDEFGGAFETGTASERAQAVKPID